MIHLAKKGQPDLSKYFASKLTYSIVIVLTKEQVVDLNLFL